MAYTNGVFYIDLVNGNDAARTALTTCIASNPSGTITRINKTAHGLVTGAVVDLTLFSSWLNAAWKITKVDDDNFDLDGAVWQTTADANGTVTPRGGSSWSDAWLTALTGASAARIQSGDEVRVAKTPDPVSIGNATWTNLSRTVTLATAQTLLVDNCETAWTVANASTIATNTSAYKQGTASLRVIKSTASSTNTLYAYKALASTTDFSAYNAITAWICAYTSGQILTNNWKLALCSDIAGAVIEYEYTIPSSLNANNQYNWYPIQVTGTPIGGNLTAIRSVALYSGSVAPATNCGIQIDNISACNSTGLGLQTLISKSTQSTFDINHPWWGIKNIVGTNIQLDANPSALDSVGFYYGPGYSGTTETTASFCRKVGVEFTSTGFVNPQFKANGTGVTYAGGWDTTTTVKNGLTVIGHKDAGTNLSFSLGAGGGNTFSDFWITRSHTAVETGGNANRLINCGISNVSNWCIYSSNAGVTYASSDFTATSIICHSSNGFLFNTTQSNMRFLYCSFLSYASSSISLRTAGPGACFIGCKFLNAAAAAQPAVYFEYQQPSFYQMIDCVSDYTISSGNGYGHLRLKNCLITSATEFNSGYSYSEYRTWSQQHDQTAFDYIFAEGATANTQATDRAGATGNMWRMVITSSSRNGYWPFRLPVAHFAVNASSLVTVKAWMKKSNATAVNGRLLVRQGQLAGISADQIVTLADNTNWQQLTLTFTPTEAGVFQVEAVAEYSTAVGNVFIDEIEVTQA